MVEAQPALLAADVAQHLAHLRAFGGVIKAAAEMPLRERRQVQVQRIAGRRLRKFRQIPHRHLAGRRQPTAPLLLEVPPHALEAPQRAVALHGSPVTILWRSHGLTLHAYREKALIWKNAGSPRRNQHPLELLLRLTWQPICNCMPMPHTG